MLAGWPAGVLWVLGPVVGPDSCRDGWHGLLQRGPEMQRNSGKCGLLAMNICTLAYTSNLAHLFAAVLTPTRAG